MEKTDKENGFRGRLESLIREAEKALDSLSAYTTQENQNALRYMVCQAESVLRGEEICPVSGSREFFQMDSEERMRFVYSHYVMFGFGKESGAQDEFYGLKQALEWFIRSDCRNAEEGYAREKEDCQKDTALFCEHSDADYLLFSQKEWEKIKSDVQHDPQIREQYGKIRAIADRSSLEGIKGIWRNTWENGAVLPEGEELYSDTAKGLNFQVPDGSKKARLLFTLPKQGVDVQEFKIRKIRIASASGEEWLVGDSPVRLGRNAERWECPKVFPVKAGSVYTIHFQVNQRQKLKKGILVSIFFEDEDGKETGSFNAEYNRKAWYPVIFYNLDMQCNAICYGVTGELIYAQKAMYQMLLFLDDFCQGAAYWMCYNSRPEGRDNYGAVQAGRNLASVAMTYAFIKDALIWEEKERFLRLAEFALNDVFDLRDRTCLTAERRQWGCGNWQTDMCIGAAMLAAAVKEIPYRRQWILNAEAVLSAQLSCHLNEDGSWPESLRYHHATLEHFCTFARFWEHETGENWFLRNHLERMFAYSIGVQMPPYEYFDNRICTPPFGDHKLGNGGEYQILGAWIGKVAETDETLASQMLETWGRAGYPTGSLNGEALAAELLFLTKSDSLKDKVFSKEYRTSSRVFRNAGLFLLRREQKGICLAVMCNEEKIGHGHLDQGSFLYYYQNVPVIMDSGIEGYFDATAQWHISSYAHACMMFGRKREMKEEELEINLTAGNFAGRLGWCDTPGIARLLGYAANGSAEWIQMRIENPEGEGYQLRTITLNEEGAVCIRDKVEDYEGDVLFSLPMLMKQVHLECSENKARAVGVGYYGVNLVVESVRPVKKAWVENGRVTPMHPEDGTVSQIPFLRMIADAEDGFEVMVRAYMKRAIHCWHLH